MLHQLMKLKLTMCLYCFNVGNEKQDKSDGMQAVNIIPLLKEKIAFLSGE